MTFTDRIEGSSLLTRLKRRVLAVLVGLVEQSVRAAPAVITAAALITAGSLYYVVNHLAIDTNTLGMLDASLPFRQREIELDRAFPKLADNAVIVIDAETPGAAEDAAATLVTELRARPELFDYVFAPEVGEFFKHNGLLYLDTGELQDLADGLAEAQPLLATLAAEQSLRGLFQMLSDALDQDLEPATQKLVVRMLDEVSHSVEDLLAGRESRASWRSELFESDRESSRQFVLVRPRLDYSSLQPGATALNEIRSLIGKLQADADQGLRIRLTGSVAMEDDELASVSGDAAFAGMMSFTLVCLVTIWGLRSARMVSAILLTLAMGLVWIAGLATATVGALNLISVNFAVLFIGMGVDFGIQFAMRYLEEARAGGERSVLASRTARGIGASLALASVLAALCFFAFVPTSYRGLAELGIIAGCGMFVALLANLTVLPAVLALIAPRTAPPAAAAGMFAGFRIRRHARLILVVTALAVALIAVVAPRTRFDFDPLNMRDPSTESVRTFIDLMRDPDTSPYTISVLAPDLSAADALAERIESLHEVDQVITLSSFVPDDQREKLQIIADLELLLGPDLVSPASAAPPDAEAEVAAIDKLGERLGALPAGYGSPALSASAGRLAAALNRLHEQPGWPGTVIPDLRRRLIADLPQSLERLADLLTPTEITLASIPEELKLRYLGMGGKARIEVFPSEDPRDPDALRAFVRSVQSVAPNATDAPVDLVEAGDAVIEASLQAAGYALVTTVVILLFMLRSTVSTFLVLVPVFMAVGLTLTASVLLNRPLDFANIIALPLLLGLSVAYGVYLVLRLRSGVDLDDLFRTNTPRAIFFSALTTIVSFGTLTFASHRGMSGMGMLVTLSIGFAVLCTLLVLPALIAALERWKPLASS